MKKLFAILTLFAVLFSCVACQDAQDGSSNTNSYEEIFSPYLPDEFSFVFSVTDYSEDEVKVFEKTMSQVSDYRYYCTDGVLEDALLFRFVSDDKYSHLVYDTETQCFADYYARYIEAGNVDNLTDEEIEEAYLISENQVNVMSMSYTSLLTHYSSCASRLVEVGTETVAGRECTVYELDPSLMGNLKNLFFVSKYYVDREYDLCLKYVITEENKRRSFEFECIDFSTTDISIPITE